MLAGETLFLVTAGAPVWSSSSHFFATTPAVATLERDVGSATVASGSGVCLSTGILPNVNDAYGIHELNFYDPSAPNRYWSAWQALTGQSEGFYYAFYEYCPNVDTVALARRYGVQFILEPHGTAGPKGSSFVTQVGGEELYRVPGASAATLTAIPANGTSPPPDAPGTPVAVTHSDPATWHIVTNTRTAQVLRLRLTDVPGWYASIDGKPLTLQRFSGIMLQARIPPGHHVIVLHYWPETFTVGLILASCAAMGLGLTFVVAHLRNRRNSQSRLPNPPDALAA